MHRCLQLPEISTAICRFLFFDTDPAGRSGALAVAQTCRLLYEPATDVIWHRIPNLKPITSCIPKEIWREEDDGLPDSTPLAPLTLVDLKRCRDLGRRVHAFGRNIDSDETSDDDLAEFQYQALQLAMSGENLLPNVSEVNINMPSSTTLTYAPLFTHRQIQTLNIYISTEDKPRKFSIHLLGFLSSLDIKYPCLQRFGFSIDNFKPFAEIDLLNRIEGALMGFQWSNLTALRLSTKSSINIIRSLYQYPSLKEVQIDILPQETRTKPDDPQLTTTPLLPEIEDFTLEIPSLVFAIDFFDLIPGRRPLRVLRFWILGARDSTSARWTKVIDHVQECCYPDKLEELTIDDRDDGDLDDPYVPFAITIDQLRPLLPFRSFKRVHISTCGTLELDDSILATLTNAWPMLNYLRLDGSNSTSVSLLGLATIAENCRHLERLSIEFHSPLPMTSKPGLKPRFGQRLTELDVLMSPIEKPAPMAAFLSDLFPGLLIISWDHAEDTQADKLWTQVEDLLPTFIEARSHEIARFDGW